MSTNKPSKLVVVDHLQSCDTFNNYIDIVNYLLKNTTKNSKNTLDTILTTNHSSSKGFRFEAISFVLTLLKCVENLDYTECHEGTISTHKEASNIIDLLSKNIRQGNNDMDMCFVNGDTTIAVSCKYYQSDKAKKDKQGVINIKTSFDLLNHKRMDNGQQEEKFKIALFVRDKNVVLQHKYKDKNGIEKNIIDEIIKDNLLFDESDLVKAISCFNSRFKDCTSLEDVLTISDFKRKQLVKMLHQRIAEIKFQRSFDRNYSQNWCLSHKPRSGKSITLLLIAKHMLMSGFKRILVLTSVPATFESFRNALNTYVDFKGINHISQDKCHDIPYDFTGIIFCSVQFLKIGKDKVDLIKYLNFEGIIADEAHLAISTNKTKSTLQMNSSDSSEEIDEDVVSLCSKAKSCVFASGTSLKTLNYYKIPASRNYTWDIEDESFMKAIVKQEADASIFEEAMKLRHGQEYSECRNDITLNQDYDKYPTLMLMRYIFPECIVSQIDKYNKKYKADIGMSFKSILALRVDKESLEKGKNKKPRKGKSKDDSGNKRIKYLPQFKLDEDEEGCDMLKAVFEQIVSRSKTQETILKKCENTQTNRNSRRNTKEEPKLIIIYLPVNTGNSTILELQQATKAFIEKFNIWPNHTVEYTSSMGDSCDMKESYDKKIQSMLKKAKNLNKRGCILLLGNQGRVGITYKDCDITISLDDGHNLEQKKQSDYRAMTEAPGKTIGINVDMNVQRYYANIMRYLTELRKRIGKNLSNAEILHFAYKNNILVVGPDEFSDCIVNEQEVTSYFKKLASEIASEIDDSIVLNSFECDDELRHMIIADIKARQSAFQVENGDSFEGLQQDLNKGVVKPDITRETKSEAYCENEVSDDVVKEITNKTLELFKQYLLPLLALISTATNIKDFCKIIESATLSKPVWDILGYKKIELEPSKKKIIVNIMKIIMENNEQIVSQIREIYETASPSRLRTLIERHFIPSQEEKKNNAEVPTPVKLVDDMLDKIPSSFWTNPHRVYEPCCGKGNFVLGIFDKFYIGLEKVIPDEIERCKVIATECIYFADISPLNVFITTELVKCHIQSYCGIDELDYEFNSYVGDTLELNITEVWAIDGFSGVVMNPPYNSSGNTATGNTIWQLFAKKALNEWLNPNGYLCAVHPPGWRKPNTEKGKFTGMFELMAQQNKMLHLEIHNTKDGMKTFKCGTRYDWYIVQKAKPYNITTTVVDENGQVGNINFTRYQWLPNSNIELISSIVAKEGDEKCPIMYSRTSYGADKKATMSKTQNETFRYPCIHSTPKEGTRYMYSSVNDRGHFGVSKVIFGESGINNPLRDINGEFAMTHGAMAIEVTNENEATNIISAITSDKFNDVIKSCLFSSFRIDWNIFASFKKDFWKEFI
jgi:hypothetical protein